MLDTMISTLHEVVYFPPGRYLSASEQPFQPSHSQYRDDGGLTVRF